MMLRRNKREHWTYKLRQDLLGDQAILLSEIEKQK